MFDFRHLLVLTFAATTGMAQAVPGADAEATSSAAAASAPNALSNSTVASR